MNVNLHVYLYLLMAETFVHFSMVLFYRFGVLYCILCVLPYGVINNNNKIT